MDQRCAYTIELRGYLPDGVAAELGDFEVRAGEDFTSLSGSVADSAALYGLLARLEALGVALVAVWPDRHEPTLEDHV